MKTIIALAGIGCFLISTLCGVSLKTWRDFRAIYESQFIPANLIQKDLKNLSEMNI